MCNIERFLGVDGISRFIGNEVNLNEYIKTLCTYLEFDIDVVCLTDEVTSVTPDACPSGKCQRIS